MKHSPEFERFDATMGRLLAVQPETYKKRLEEFKERPKTRGPKRKVKSAASPDSGASA
jgi:hypothetical protein